LEQAARLFGAYDAIINTTGYGFFQVDRATFDRGRAAAYAELGEERWQTAVEEGRAMSVDEAVAYALEPVSKQVEALPVEATPQPTAEAMSSSPDAEPYLQQLSKREVEVLRLVAQGLTAPEVAERLYLSVRTVENHLRSIYGKLNVSTRAAATRFAIEHGLLKD
jgi:DNA-binding NarL/FixJ family response regulator